MTLDNLREHVMFQTNNDVDDLSEFQPSVDRYLNEGYDRLVEAYAKTHIDTENEEGQIEFPSLQGDEDVPNIPTWAHRAIGDYGAYCVYRNGNQYKQARGDRYLQMFNEVLFKLRWLRKDGKRAHFYNLYEEPVR